MLSKAASSSSSVRIVTRSNVAQCMRAGLLYCPSSFSVIR